MVHPNLSLVGCPMFWVSCRALRCDPTKLKVDKDIVCVVSESEQWTSLVHLTTLFWTVMGSEPHLYMSSALLCPLHFIADMSLEAWTTNKIRHDFSRESEQLRTPFVNHHYLSRENYSTLVKSQLLQSSVTFNCLPYLAKERQWVKASATWSYVVFLVWHVEEILFYRTKCKIGQ